VTDLTTTALQGYTGNVSSYILAATKTLQPNEITRNFQRTDSS